MFANCCLLISRKVAHPHRELEVASTTGASCADNLLATDAGEGVIDEVTEVLSFSSLLCLDPRTVMGMIRSEAAELLEDDFPLSMLVLLGDGLGLDGSPTASIMPSTLYLSTLLLKQCLYFYVHKYVRTFVLCESRLPEI